MKKYIIYNSLDAFEAAQQSIFDKMNIDDGITTRYANPVINQDNTKFAMIVDDENLLTDAQKTQQVDLDQTFIIE